MIARSRQSVRLGSLGYKVGLMDLSPHARVTYVVGRSAGPQGTRFEEHESIACKVEGLGRSRVSGRTAIHWVRLSSRGFLNLCGPPSAKESLSYPRHCT